MSSRDLRVPRLDEGEQTGSEVQFALVIARMIDTVKSDPELMRRTVYDLARHKLQEQLGSSGPAEMKQAELALEAAIRGVEQFSQEQIFPAPSMAPQFEAPMAVPYSPRTTPPFAARLGFKSVAEQRHRLFWTTAKRTAVVLLVASLTVAVVSQRERLGSLGQVVQNYGKSTSPPAPEASPSPSANLPPKPAAPQPGSLLPREYGIYAIGESSFTELQLLPGRPPDVRIAVSAAFKLPRSASLPNGHPKFLVFRRDVATNILERAEVRVIAKITREFSSEAAGKRPGEDDVWVIRNFSYPYRVSPVPENSEMYEVHSEDPGLELPPGNYALILKNQAYYFSVAGEIADSKQCIERVVTTNGTFYSACKKP
ncbi:hypothetical protein ABIB68_007480 [Bradyrhizobium sp. F1.2.2]